MIYSLNNKFTGGDINCVEICSIPCYQFSTIILSVLLDGGWISFSMTSSDTINSFASSHVNLSAIKWLVIAQKNHPWCSWSSSCIECRAVPVHFFRFRFSDISREKNGFPVPILVLCSNANFQVLVAVSHAATAAYQKCWATMKLRLKQWRITLGGAIHDERGSASL